jgi:hypothetical protein
MTITSETSTIYDVAKTRLTAATQLEKAKATLWHFGGAGLLAAMAGMGIGLACFGYSYVADGRVQAQKMADAMVQALERAKLTTTGELRLAAGSTVGLAPGGQVALAPNAVVRMDPSSTVRVAGNVNADPNPVTPPPPVQAVPSPQNKIVTQYTVFKSVLFDKGKVVTGWSFGNSTEISPATQYCYYEEPSVDTVRVRTNLGTNGKMLDNLKPRPGLDLIGAFNNCTWFSDAH